MDETEERKETIFKIQSCLFQTFLFSDVSEKNRIKNKKYIEGLDSTSAFFGDMRAISLNEIRCMRAGKIQ